MEIKHPEQLEPSILLSIVNEKLRLDCQSLADLVYDMAIEVQQLERSFAELGYIYDPQSNQFVTP